MPKKNYVPWLRGVRWRLILFTSASGPQNLHLEQSCDHHCHLCHPHHFHPMVDVVCDPNMLEVGPVLLPSLAEVDVQVVQCDRWVGPGQQLIVRCTKFEHASGLQQFFLLHSTVV